MMNSDSAATPVSAADDTPTYFVVPVKSGSDSSITIWFYQQLETDATWVKVAPNTLDAASQGGNTDQVRLVQPSEADIIANTNLQAADLDLSIALYAAVARTLAPSETMPRIYAAGVKSIITVDVAPLTTRRFTMVFTKHAGDNTEVANVVELMSVNMPEIKNGVGTGKTQGVNAS